MILGGAPRALDDLLCSALGRNPGRVADHQAMMMADGGGLRERKKAEARRRIQQHAITAMRGALSEGLAAVHEAHQDALLARTRLIFTTPALRARMADNQHATESCSPSLWPPARAHPANDPRDAHPTGSHAGRADGRAQRVVQSDGAEQLPVLVDRALRALRPSPNTVP